MPPSYCLDNFIVELTHLKFGLVKNESVFIRHSHTNEIVCIKSKICTHLNSERPTTNGVILKGYERPFVYDVSNM